MSGGDVKAREARLRDIREALAVGAYESKQTETDVEWLLAEIEAAEARTARLRDALREARHCLTAPNQEGTQGRLNALAVIRAALSPGSEQGEDASTIHADLWNDTETAT